MNIGTDASIADLSDTSNTFNSTSNEFNTESNSQEFKVETSRENFDLYMVDITFDGQQTPNMMFTINKGDNTSEVIYTTSANCTVSLHFVLVKFIICTFYELFWMLKCVFTLSRKFLLI